MSQLEEELSEREWWVLVASDPEVLNAGCGCWMLVVCVRCWLWVLRVGCGCTIFVVGVECWLWVLDVGYWCWMLAVDVG